MPTYDYVCTKCQHELEAFQSMRDAVLKKCPACGKQGLRRQIGGGAGLIFKGTGFYITDYKKQTGGPKESGESPAPAKTTSDKTAAAAK